MISDIRFYLGVLAIFSFLSGVTIAGIYYEYKKRIVNITNNNFYGPEPTAPKHEEK